jgi:hypothetical protein
MKLCLLVRRLWSGAPEKAGRRAAKKEQGFSLVETTIAAGVSSIIFTAVFAGFSFGYTMLQNTRENLRATQIALSRMEGLRLCAWDTDQLWSSSIVPANFVDYYYPVGMNGQDTNVVYSGTMTVTSNNAGSSLPASYRDKMAQVTVTISWTNNHNGVVNVHQRTMKTYVSKYGIQNYVYSH